MASPKMRSLAGALAGASAALWVAPSYAHSVCGDRIFPATLAIDDPGVTDELSLPTLTWLPQNANGAQEFDATFNWAKPSFRTSRCRSEPVRPGSIPADTAGRPSTPKRSTNSSASPNTSSWARSGSKSSGATPEPAPWLGPLLLFAGARRRQRLRRSADRHEPPAPVRPDRAGELDHPGPGVRQRTQYATTINYGFSIQYSLPYYNSHVGEISNDFVKHLIPLVEGVFSTPSPTGRDRGRRPE